MKVIEAESCSAEDPIAEAPVPRMGVWWWWGTQREADTSRSDRATAQDDEGSAPSGWWLVPSAVGGLLFWAWLIRQVARWAASLF